MDESASVGTEAQGGSAAKTYTEGELQAAIRDANKGLEKNRDEVLADLGKAKDRLRAFEGVDLDEYKNLKKAAEAAERERAERAGDYKAMEDQMKANHAKEVEKLTGRIDTLNKALERRLIDADASAAIQEARGSIKGLLPHLRPHLKVVEQEGEFVAQVVDSRGHPRISDGKGTPMTIRDLVEEMRSDADLARLFDGTGSSGGGASRSAVSGGGPIRVIPADSKWSAADIEAIARGKARTAI